MLSKENNFRNAMSEKHLTKPLNFTEALIILSTSVAHSRR